MYQNTIRTVLWIIAVVLSCAAVGFPQERKPFRIASPDARVAVVFYLNDSGAPCYRIELNGKPVLRDSQLGLVRDDADFTKGLKLVSQSETTRVNDRYEILTAKRRDNQYVANRQVFHLQTGSGQKLDIFFQVSNDGVAFRYLFPETSSELHRLKEELSSFHMLPGTKAWLQPMSVAKTGWQKVNPCYEEFYEKEIAVGTPSPMGAGWVFPALFQTGDVWLLISEAPLMRNYSATRLRSDSPDGKYLIGFPDPREDFQGGPVNPASNLPWLTPWRFVVVGSLKTITESMLGVHLADPAPATKLEIRPGRASWSWPLLGDSNTTYDVQERFINYAAVMGWEYCLIDALWDKQIGYDKVKELIDSAHGKGVRILLWYNSAGDWNTTPQTPRDLMVTRESRIREFERLKEMGVAGLKIDFFGGDGQSVIGYYLDILEDAAKYGFLINFHGATLPRGIHRTYPHLMTVEAVRGLEYVTFEQSNAEQQASHAAMLPFTRNVFDPMDYTPVVLDRINKIERRTTSGFELALSVLFTSGIQHYAEIPDGMAKAPAYVRDFLKSVPSIWDDVKFLDGYPGKFAVLARHGGGRWYIAGINGEAKAKKLTLNLNEIPVGGSATLITDGAEGNLSFRRETVRLVNKKVDVSMLPNGGFVLVFD